MRFTFVSYLVLYLCGSAGLVLIYVVMDTLVMMDLSLCMLIMVCIGVSVVVITGLDVVR